VYEDGSPAYALRDAGCYAGCTFPALGSPAQPRKVNVHYYAAEDGRPKSYDDGVEVAVGLPLSVALLVVVVGGIGAVSHWVLDTSVFHQMASAPAVPPHWEANGIMTAIGIAGALIGGLAFSRRDLHGE